MSYHKANLSVHVRSELVPEDKLRSWLVSVDARLSGEPVALASVASKVEVSCPVADVEVECLGQVDQFTAVYRVLELEPDVDLPDLPIKVKLVPRFSPQLENFHRLHATLAGLVGRNYLVHPKYALTLVLDYARQQQLIKHNYIVCDAFLETLFNTRWIKVKSLWDNLTKLISKFDGECVMSSHKLGSLNQSTAEVQPIQLDANNLLYPGDWSCNFNTTKPLSRRQTETSSKSSRSLKRCKTI